MRCVLACWGVFLALLLSGCAGYRLGSTDGQRAGVRSVQIVPFANRTLEPRLSDAVTAAVRQEIQRDGTFQLATREAGDLVVSGEIINLVRTEISFLATDVVTARDYQLSFTTHVLVRERYSDKVILDRKFTGSSLMRSGNDLPSVERQTVPLVAADLARQITSALADGTW